MPTQRLSGDERRHSLILIAYQLIAKEGFEGLRVRDVAAQAGVNIATLHYYFASKEDLVRGVVEYLLSQFITVVTPEPESGDETPIQQLERVFADLDYQLRVAPEMFVVMTEIHLRSQRDPAIQTILKNMDEGWHSHIESIFQEGIAKQNFRPDLDPKRAASEVTALIKGISLQVISALDTFSFDRIRADIDRWFVQS